MTTDEVTSLMLRQINEIERMDEAQILAELQGDPDIVRDLVYSFPDRGGRRQKGLSYNGTREVMFMRGNLHLGEPVITEHPNPSDPTGGYVRVMAQATDLKRNVSIWGGVHQPYNQWVWLETEEQFQKRRKKPSEKRRGEYQPDPYVFQKAIAKAQRNAIKNVLPASVIKAVITQWDAVAKGGDGHRQAAPPPRVDPETGVIEGEPPVIVDDPPAAETPKPPRPPRDLSTITSINTWAKACHEDFGLQPQQAAEKAGYARPQDIGTVDELRRAYQQIAATLA